MFIVNIKNKVRSTENIQFIYCWLGTGIKPFDWKIEQVEDVFLSSAQTVLDVQGPL